jgi:hypothetical protein
MWKEPNPMKTNARPLNTTCKLVALVATTLLVGCTAVLPSTTSISKLPWKDYTGAKTAFDSVEANTTSRKQLIEAGFNPDAMPNSRLLNYVDVVNLFGSAFKLEDLPKGIKTCVDARDACQAYVLTAQHIKAKREGNIATDLFGFGKLTNTTGWEFQATLVLVNDTVVYKLWKGTPSIATSERQRTPLGPMQNLSGIIPKPGF